MARIEVFTRAGCKLCAQAVELVRRIAADGDEVVLRDIDADPALHRRYTVRVPVVAVDGREVAELEVREDDLRAALSRPPAEPDGRPAGRRRRGILPWRTGGLRGGAGHSVRGQAGDRAQG